MSIFTKISLKKPSSSRFNLSHDRKFSLNMGELTPILCQEVVPGDKFNIRTQHMLRFAPMLAPVMHEVNVFTHYFFVPNRLIFDDWEKFITGGENGTDISLLPTLSGMEVTERSLGDYLGLPVMNEFHPEKISRLPFNAYTLIYNEYYRDQNLIDPLPIDKSGGNIDVPNDASPELFDALTKLQRRAWQHDYFTSALPFAQKGEPVRLPINGVADVYFESTGQPDKIRGMDGNVLNTGVEDRHQIKNGVGETVVDAGAGNPTVPVNLDNSDSLKVDLETSTQATINDLRKAFKLQEWLEKNARAGSRYVESILAHFGVRSSDARLQRPEYIGGNMSPVMISEVMQTSATTTTPLGEMGGHGLNLGNSDRFSKFFEEHGYIIGIMSVMPKTAYQQGIPRHFSKLDKFDYFWPEFQHIGEQEIKNKELRFNHGTPEDNETFGYIPRYAEYKYIPSTVHGDFKKSLDFWHMGRIFNDSLPPALNKQFIECLPTNRIFAVEDSVENPLWCHLFHDISAQRKMSYYGDPSFR